MGLLGTTICYELFNTLRTMVLAQKVNLPQICSLVLSTDAFLSRRKIPMGQAIDLDHADPQVYALLAASADMVVGQNRPSGTFGMIHPPVVVYVKGLSSPPAPKASNRFVARWRRRHVRHMGWGAEKKVPC